MRPASIGEVARAANFTRSAVSRDLDGSIGFPDETVRRMASDSGDGCVAALFGGSAVERLRASIEAIPGGTSRRVTAPNLS